MQELLEKYEELLEQRRQVEKIKHYLKDIEKELIAVEEELRFLDLEMQKENKGIERLQKKSLVSFFYKINGKHYHKIEKELSDFHRLVLIHNSQEKSKELLEFEKIVLLKKLNNVEKIDQEIKAISQKVDDLKLSNSGTRAQKILDKVLKCRRMEATKIELEEVVSAGEKLVAAIKDMGKTYGEIKPERNGFFSKPNEFISFNQLEGLRQAFPAIKLLVLKFDREYREAFPASPNFKIFHRDKNYERLTKALHDRKSYNKIKRDNWKMRYYFTHLEGKAKTKVHAVSRRLKTLGRQIEKLENKIEHQRKLLM
ncbi:MAG: hypothetical protein AAFZ15_28625 [Bacteroidota bacterium]